MICVARHLESTNYWKAQKLFSCQTFFRVTLQRCLHLGRLVRIVGARRSLISQRCRVLWRYPRCETIDIVGCSIHSFVHEHLMTRLQPLYVNIWWTTINEPNLLWKWWNDGRMVCQEISVFSLGCDKTLWLGFSIFRSTPIWWSMACQSKYKPESWLACCQLEF